jgi:hypothetical protein
MIKKMKLFRFCRRSLAALPVFLLFSACDQLVPPSGGNGVDIPVKIRAVSIAGGAQNETITRAGGEKRIVGEPIVQDLGDGMLAEITVEEDLSALRADPTPEPLGSVSSVKFRVIAVSSDDKVYSYADYTTGSGTIAKVDNGTELHVLSGGSYYFVCISYNNSNLPPAPELNATLGNVSVTAGSNDLLYQTFTPAEAIPTSGEVNLSFTNLTHQLARVQLTLEVAAGKTITSVPGSISLDAPTSGDFNLADGAFSNGLGTTVFTGWPASPNSTTVESGKITFIPKTNYTLTIPAGALTLDNKSLPTSALSISSDKFNFVANGSYTLSITLKEVSRSNKFAGSNIYWNGSKLTFDDHGDYTNTKYQGVYFKWGSLIGVSPAQTSGSDDFSSGTTANDGKNDGTPIYLKVNGEWKKTNVTYATSEGWFGSGAVSDKTGSSAWVLFLPALLLSLTAHPRTLC